MHVPATIVGASADGMVTLRASGIATWLRRSGQQPVSLRFATALVAGEPLLVLGLRPPSGPGIDLLVAMSEAGLLVPEPQTLRIETVEAGEPPLLVSWDEDRFAEFVAHVLLMQEELPEHPVWSAMAAAFV
ncbi:MAG: hypothetical protein OWU32_03830 [Firmicutes bacterium]|nr:hypothetical protein [Bacillota bacterium]